MTAWPEAKVSAFREGFYSFCDHVIISSKDGRVILGESFYRAQYMFFDMIFNGLREDVHDFYVLKSRQLGISTGTRALTLYWLGMHEGLRGAMVFDTAFNTQAARAEILETIANLPKKLKFPAVKRDSRDVLILENDSHLRFMQAGTKNSRAGGGLGRSLGLNLAHCSECSSWANPEGVQSFRQSLSEHDENRFYVWESTGRGFDPIWYPMWREAGGDPHTKARMFAGWWSKDNQEINRDDPRFDVYGIDKPTKREQAKIDIVREHYKWKITPEQLAWFRWKTDPARDLDDDDPEDTIAAQEQAVIEEDAFQQTGSSFFIAEKLSAASAKIFDWSKPQAFKFWGGSSFIDSDIRPSERRRDVEFRMWEGPATDAVYVIAADPAFGRDEKNNNSAAQVLRCYADCIEQVGEYASATINPHHFAWLLWTLIGYYGSTKPNCRAYFILEINGPGEEVWRQFQATEQTLRNGHLRIVAKELGISNIFQNCQNYIYTKSDSMASGSAWQFKTSTQNKVQLMEACRNYFHNGQYLIRSIELLEEMKTITRDGDSIGAEGRNRDDRTFASALGIRCWDERVRRPLSLANRTREAEQAKSAMSIQDQWQIFQRNMLDGYIHNKEKARAQQRLLDQRAAWRQGAGRRPGYAGARRW